MKLEECIKNIKMTKKNINKKNTAAIITLIIEFIKVLTLLIFLDKFNPTISKLMFIYSIISTIIAVFILFNDNYDKIYKYIILDISSVIFLLSNIIGGILIETIILAADKKMLKNITKKEKIKRLPITLYHKRIVYTYLFISILICYQYLYLNDILFYILVLTSLILFFKEDIINSLKAFKKNVNSFINYIIKNYIIMILISNILFIVIGLIVGSESTNQQILKQDLIETTIIGILYAPIAEELLFRGCLRKIIKNDKLFILISGISFGAWHVIGYNQNILQYLYIIPYSAIGIYLSYIYSKSNNLTTNIGMHGLNNIIASITNFI